MEKEDAKVEGEISAAQEQPGTLGEKTTAGTDAPSSHGPSSAASPDVGAAEADQPASLAVTVDTVSIDGKVASETREEAADLQTDSKLEAGEVRNWPVWAGLCVRGLACPALSPAFRDPGIGRHFQHVLTSCCLWWDVGRWLGAKRVCKHFPRR